MTRGRRRRTAGKARAPALLLWLIVAAAGCGSEGGIFSRGADDAGRGGQVQDVRRRREADSIPAPGYAWVIFGRDTVRAEVAQTYDEHSRGVLFHEEVPSGTGMLFVYTGSEVRWFWMQSTRIALDIAFLDEFFRVVDIQHVEPLSEEPRESRAPFLFALEVPSGWFSEHGIGVGAKARVVFGSTR